MGPHRVGHNWATNTFFQSQLRFGTSVPITDIKELIKREEKIRSVQFSRSVVSDSLWPHESQHAKPPCPSPTPRVYSNWCPSELVMPSNYLILCHPLLLLPPIPSSIRVFSNDSTLHMRWPKFGVSTSASVLPMNTQDWAPLGWTGWIQGTLKSVLQHHSAKASIFHHSAFFTIQLSLLICINDLYIIYAYCM